MNTEQTTPATGTPEVSAVPEDFSAFEHWRNTGALPEAANQNPSDASTPAADDEDESASDSETEDTTTEQDEDAEEGKPKSKRGFRKKIDKLTGRIKQLEAELEGKRAPAPTQVETQETKPAAQTQQPSTLQFTEAEPQLEDFENIAEYTKALLKWDRGRTRFEQQQEEAQRRQADAQKAVIDGWNAKAADTKARYADYDAALDSVKDVALSPALQHALLESEHGPEIAYHLAKNPEELKRLASLAPLAAARAVGKLETQFEGQAGAPPKTTTTRAPRPITPLSGGKASPAAPSVYDDSLDFSAWEQARNAELYRR